MPSITVQVFEHTTVRVGEPLRTSTGGEHALGAAEHRALASFADGTADRYLSCGRRTVRFGSYVGVLQLGDLSLEILPKADRSEAGGHGRWHRALVHMLRVVGDLGLESQDEAQLRLDPGRLFDLFIQHFLDECERLVHQGLAKGYRTEEGNRTAFRGRLLVPEHARRNAVNAARFYVASPVYDHRNLPNLALHEALRLLDALPISAGARARARGIRHAFPELPAWRPDMAALERVRLTRNTTRYRAALKLARLILFQLAPDVRSGRAPFLALLFDMNALWERYIAALARRLRLPGVEVRTQDSRAFWRLGGKARPLRPDITLRHPGRESPLVVIDTKWKLPAGGQPSSADIKQMFCYHELFDCQTSLLLYPAPKGATRLGDTGRYVGRDHRCVPVFLGLDGDPASDLAGVLTQAIPAGADNLKAIK
ncbi:MAG: hypothetical protein VYE22_14930 [Myxococcota bacterium]|nr:hypothetical protein [Myxococcota bacterium]